MSYSWTLITYRPQGLADFERIKLLGKGCIGHVYLVRLKGTDQLYAMKVLRKADMVRLNKVIFISSCACVTAKS